MFAPATEIKYPACDPAVEQKAHQWCSNNEEHNCVCHAYSISRSESQVKRIGPSAE